MRHLLRVSASIQSTLLSSASGSTSSDSSLGWSGTSTGIAADSSMGSSVFSEMESDCEASSDTSFCWRLKSLVSQCYSLLYWSAWVPWMMMIMFYLRCGFRSDLQSSMICLFLLHGLFFFFPPGWDLLLLLWWWWWFSKHYGSRGWRFC